MSDVCMESFSSFLAHRRGALKPPSEGVVDRTLRRIEHAGKKTAMEVEIREIGRSREGRTVYAISLGEGSRAISLIAGAHADEPAGPLAALALAEWLILTEEGRGVLRGTRWRICPHVNPDGAERNAAWFSDPPKSERYLRGVVREGPTDDVEFHYPVRGAREGRKWPRGKKKPHGKARESSAESSGSDGNVASGLVIPRPENLAVARFLREGGPYGLHASLHGMAFGEGAWWLIGREWAARTATLRRALAGIFVGLGLGLHDIDRKGEKGFWRIERGFSTTPTGAAMRQFFTGRGEHDTARHFLASSMEFVQSLGGDPLVMVSEIPLFLVAPQEGSSDPSGEDTPTIRLRKRLGEAAQVRAQGDAAMTAALVREFGIRPVSFARQVEAIGRGVLAAVNWLRSGEPEARHRS